MFYTSKQVEVGLLALIKDLLPILFLSLIMYGIVWLIVSCFESVYIQLGIGIPVGAFLYLGGAYAFKIKEIKYLNIVTKKLNYGIKRIH
jgi:hypothetical protein